YLALLFLTVYTHSLTSSFFFSILPPPPLSTLFPYTTLFRSAAQLVRYAVLHQRVGRSHLRSSREPHNEQHYGAQPEDFRTGKNQQADGARGRSRPNPPRQSLVVCTRRKVQRAQHRPHSRRTHQQSQRTGISF